MYSKEQYILDAMSSRQEHNNKKLSIANWAMGMCGESRELFEELELRFVEKANNGPAIMKELGDNIWYFTALVLELDVEVVQEFDKMLAGIMDIQWAADGLKELNLILAELIKHHIFHNEDETEKIIENLNYYWQNIRCIASGLNYDLLSIMELNGAKLKHRYGGAYSHDACNERHVAEVKFTDTLEYGKILKRVVELGV